MAGPLTPRPGPDAPPDEWRRYWLDVAFTANLNRRERTWPLLLAAIVGAHLAVFAFQLSRGRQPLVALVGPRGPGVLERMGGLTGTAIEDGEPWRLVTSLFLHGDGLHLLLNGLALAGLGSLCEAVFGSTRLLWMFLLFGVAGGLASWSGTLTLSVGASGALFGWMGAVLAFGARYRGVLPHDISAALWRRLLPWAALNVVVGFLLPFLDHRAHLGGLLAGLVFGALGGNQVVPGAESRPLTRGAMLVGSALLIAYAAWSLASAWR